MLIIDILLSIPFLVKSYNIHMELILKSLAALCIGIVSISVSDFYLHNYLTKTSITFQSHRIKQT